MKVEYRRDIQNSYLVLIAENQNVEKTYDLRMITENQIEGLLSCEHKLMNNDILYYYDVTSQISLEDRCKETKIQGQDIFLLLNKLLGILDKLEEYLLSEKSLCLLPQYIYMDDKIEQIKFCYVPGENWDFQVQLRELMEYLLPYLEHENQESMMIGYGLYHYVLRERFTVEGLHAQLNLYHGLNKKIEKESVLAAKPKENEIIKTNLVNQKEEEVWQDIWEETFEDVEIDKEGSGKNEYWRSWFCAFVGLLWILSGWFLWRNFVSFLWIWGLVGILFVLVAVAIFIIVKWKKKNLKFPEKRKIEDEDEIEQNDVCTQVLNVVLDRKSYILRSVKNENDCITLHDKSIYIVGRDENLADIVVKSSVISRKHGQFRVGNNCCFLMDLYSKNGIRVNGEEIVKGEEIELFGGELIQFADVGYYFQQEK